jgi:hypothetical protein
MRHRNRGTNDWGWQDMGPTLFLWRMVFWCATKMTYFCGAPGLVRHINYFYGTLVARAPQNYIPSIRAFLLVLARTGYQQPQQQQYQQDQQYVKYQSEQQQQNMIPGPIASRLGPRSLAPNDACFKLDKIYQTELVERQGAPGTMCFGPRIMGKPAPYCFQLARGARTYNGSTKPEDCLEDYSTAVNIAGGNLRWAVCYVPQMLEGPARI